jgi:hypothetical protein
MKKEQFKKEHKVKKEVTTSKIKVNKSLLLNPDGLTHVVMIKKEIVPVSVFGQRLPYMLPQPFSLPWMVQEDETVTEDSMDNNTKPPSQTIPSTNASNTKTKLKVGTPRNSALGIQSKPCNFVTKPHREPLALKQIPGLTLTNDETKYSSSKTVLLQQRSASLRSNRDSTMATTKENINMPANSLRSKTHHQVISYNNLHLWLPV